MKLMTHETVDENTTGSKISLYFFLYFMVTKTVTRRERVVGVITKYGKLRRPKIFNNLSLLTFNQ